MVCTFQGYSTQKDKKQTNKKNTNISAPCQPSLAFEKALSDGVDGTPLEPRPGGVGVGWQTLLEPSPGGVGWRTLLEPSPGGVCSRTPLEPSPSGVGVGWRTLLEPSPGRVGWRTLLEPSPGGVGSRTPLEPSLGGVGWRTLF